MTPATGTHAMQRRNLPRQLAPVLFAAVDIINGASLIAARHDRSPALAKVPGSLTGWGIAFILIGVLIPFGTRNTNTAWITSLTAIGVWGVWTSLIVQAVNPPLVSVHAPAPAIGFTILHFLLCPYRRRHERL